MKEGFPTPLTAKLTGVTEPTLNNWNRRGFLRPSIHTERLGGNGNARMYSFRDLIAIRVANDLREQGIDVRSLRRVVSYLRKRKGLDLSPSDVLASTYLVTDGRDVYEVVGDAELLSTLRKPGQCGFLIVTLNELVNDVQRKVLALEGALGRIAGAHKPTVSPARVGRFEPDEAPSSIRRPNDSPRKQSGAGARRALASE
jgi:DNA-binding transcriptional MerR regulator